MNTLVVGYTGFIGKHVELRLRETLKEVAIWSRCQGMGILSNLVRDADVVYHCSGATRTATPTEWRKDLEITRTIIANLKPTVRIVYTSSTQAGEDSHYGKTKAETEQLLYEFQDKNPRACVEIHQLANVYGKWAKPHHNSIIATWCHQLSRGEPLTPVTDDTSKRWFHIDEVVSGLINYKKPLGLQFTPSGFLGELEKIYTRLPSFEGFSDFVGVALSYTEPIIITHQCGDKEDSRGVLMEVARNRMGQENFLTIRPWKIRGNHWHHNRVEEFVLFGQGLELHWKHVLSGVTGCAKATNHIPIRVIIPPGWTHAVVNQDPHYTYAFTTWSNTIYNPENPDTIPKKLL